MDNRSPFFLASEGTRKTDKEEKRGDVELSNFGTPGNFFLFPLFSSSDVDVIFIVALFLIQRRNFFFFFSTHFQIFVYEIIPRF